MPHGYASQVVPGFPPAGRREISRSAAAPAQVAPVRVLVLPAVPCVYGNGRATCVAWRLVRKSRWHQRPAAEAPTENADNDARPACSRERSCDARAAPASAAAKQAERSETRQPGKAKRKQAVVLEGRGRLPSRAAERVRNG